MPPVHETLKDIGEAKVMTVIDLKKCYWQILLTESAKPFTAFVTPVSGQYLFEVAAFGLQNAGRTCSHFISQEVLAGYVREFALNFQDDIAICSRTWEEHLVYVALVLERLQTYGLVCAIEKCFFGKQRLEFLGHIITEDHNEAKPEHVKAVVDAAPS